MNFHRNRLTQFLFQRFVAPHPAVRRLLVRLWISNRDEFVEIGGIRLFINSRGESGYLNAANHSQAAIVLRDEFSTLINLALLLRAGDTFVDVGANVGLYTVALSRLQNVQAGMRFYAFEPNPVTVARLRRSLEHIDVEIFQEAVSETRSVLHFHEGGTSGTFEAGPSGEKALPVQAVTLDEKGIVGGSIILKIDVEHHEIQVLKGAVGLFAAERIKAVYLDGHADPQIPQWLLQRGFLLFDGRTLLPASAETFSLLAIHRRFVNRG